MTGRGAGANEGIRSPGPGAYTVEVPKSKMAASMKSRHYDKPDAFQPGPGQTHNKLSTAQLITN